MDRISTYKENAVTTRAPGRLIVLLYEGAIKFLRQAITALEAEDWAQKGIYINKALAILGELDSALDMEAGGEVAENLRSLYLFSYKHLVEANAKRDPQRIRDVISLLEELNEGWKAISA